MSSQVPCGILSVRTQGDSGKCTSLMPLRCQRDCWSLTSFGLACIPKHHSASHNTEVSRDRIYLALQVQHCLKSRRSDAVQDRPNPSDSEPRLPRTSSEGHHISLSVRTKDLSLGGSPRALNVYLLFLHCPKYLRGSSQESPCVYSGCVYPPTPKRS